jgi:hypothetical protein
MTLQEMPNARHWEFRHVGSVGSPENAGSGSLNPKLMTIPHLIWILVTALRFGGVFAAFIGFAIFGAYFVGGNARVARSGDGAIPASSWRGAGPRLGMMIFALGASMLLCAFILTMYLPSGI